MLARPHADGTPRAEPLFLALQYIRDGSLNEVLYKRRHPTLFSDTNGWLPVQTQLVVHVGVFSALEYLSSLRIMHRDVKPDNILVVVNPQQARVEKALLADFGEAKSVRRTITARGTQAGTPVCVRPPRFAANMPRRACIERRADRFAHRPSRAGTWLPR